MLDDRARAEIRIGVPRLDEPPRKVGEAADIRHGFSHGTVDRGVGQPHQLEGDIRGHHLPGDSPLLVQGKTRIRLVEKILAQFEAVAGPVGVEWLLDGQSVRQAGDQNIGPLQVVVFQQRLVDFSRDRMGRRGVGHRRIEGSRGFAITRVENLARIVGFAVGIVRAARQQQHDPPERPQPFAPPDLTHHCAAFFGASAPRP